MEIVSVDWNLDVAGAKRLESAIEPLQETVAIDLSGTAFVASSGLRVLLKHAQRLADVGGSLVVCGANSTVTEVFSISGFAGIIDTYPDTEAARSAIGGAS